MRSRQSFAEDVLLTMNDYAAVFESVFQRQHGQRKRIPRQSVEIGPGGYAVLPLQSMLGHEIGQTVEGPGAVTSDQRPAPLPQLAHDPVAYGLEQVMTRLGPNIGEVTAASAAGIEALFNAGDLGSCEGREGHDRTAAQHRLPFRLSQIQAIGWQWIVDGSAASSLSSPQIKPRLMKVLDHVEPR